MGTNFWNHDTTAANNTSIGGVGSHGSNSASNFDNIVRDIAAQLKRYALDSGGATTVGGTVDIITITTAQTITAYLDGLLVAFVAAGDNTVTGVTANIDGLGAKTIKKSVAGTETALAIGDIKSSGFYVLRYRSSWASSAGAFQLIDLNHEAITSSIASLVEDTTPQLGGTLDTNSKQVRLSKGADVASATALAIGDDGNFFDVTGTTTIATIAAKGVGTKITLQFDGALTLTHSADLVLPDAEDITTVAGDVAEFVEYAAGDWLCINYQTSLSTGSTGWTLHSTVAMTSGSTADFTGIPAGIKNIRLVLQDFRPSSNQTLQIRLGDAGGLESSGYLYAGSTSNNQFPFGVASSAQSSYGVLDLLSSDGLAWNGFSVAGNASNPLNLGCTKVLSDTLTQVQAFVNSGTFSQGSLSLWYQ